MLRGELTAISTARMPNRVVNLMIGLSATEDVSLNGSPTMSPMTVAACSSLPLLLQFDLDDLLRVVPAAAGVGHVDGHVEAEHRDRDEVADRRKPRRSRQTPA